MHEQRSEVGIAAIADSQLADATSGPGLPWRQADRCRGLAAVVERGGRTHAGYDRGCSHQTDARDVGECFARWGVAQLF